MKLNLFLTLKWDQLQVLRCWLLEANIFLSLVLGFGIQVVKDRQEISDF